MKKLLKSETHRTDKKLKNQQLSAIVHMNSSRCPLNECAVAEKKKKNEET